EGVRVYNPAFDVTPSGLVSSIITESGVLRPPYGASLAASIADIARRLKSRATQTKSAYADYAG
ncbi:MAG TPA: hypothetical protein VEW94_13390, partial [Chloroflexia bacterium]|nr:hypothetical protein [Chloroflexia bacterium]